MVSFPSLISSLLSEPRFEEKVGWHFFCAYMNDESQSFLSSVLVENDETIATLPGGWDLAHAIRLGIKLFAELGANSQALSGSHVDSPCSCRAIFGIGPGSDATVSK